MPPPPEILCRVERQRALREALEKEHPEGLPPYFGHMRARTAAGEVDLLLGNASLLGKGRSIIDWRTAPLAEVFFAHDEGEDYEVDVGGRQVTGTLLERNLLTFEGGRLTGLDSGSGAVALTPEGWRRIDRSPPPTIPPRAPPDRLPFRSPLQVTLDDAQRRVVELPEDRHVLLLGEAGFGKTTVALHRLLALKARSPKRRFLGAVIVPTEGLRRLTEVMLRRRGVEDIEVWTFDAWAARMARKVFRDLPRRESEGASSAVIRLKRSGALRQVLSAYVRTRKTPPADPDHRPRSRALARRADLEHLFGDSDWFSGFPEGAVRDLLEHTRIQFLETTERAHRHVDRDALVTVDGRRIDEGTPTEDADSVDPEDYAVLFELERLRALAHGAKPAPLPHYDCLVIDEAQELSSLELSLLARSVGHHGTVIVAGDAAQQVDPTADFAGWERVMADLGATAHERATLEVSYRCPPDVTGLARTLLEPAASAWSAPMPSVASKRHPSSLHLTAWLVDELRALTDVDPSASIAVVAHGPVLARALVRFLGYGLEARLALEGDFAFQPGALVTTVQEVKGLEFDYVIVPDADAATYPPLPDARRALYVAVTRASYRLGLAATARWSPLLAAVLR